ncbi:predicted protein, partial [Nematostella vectensis]
MLGRVYRVTNVSIVTQSLRLNILCCSIMSESQWYSYHSKAGELLFYYNHFTDEYRWVQGRSQTLDSGNEGPLMLDRLTKVKTESIAHIEKYDKRPRNEEEERVVDVTKRDTEDLGTVKCEEQEEVQIMNEVGEEEDDDVIFEEAEKEEVGVEDKEEVKKEGGERDGEVLVMGYEDEEKVNDLVIEEVKDEKEEDDDDEDDVLLGKEEEREVTDDYMHCTQVTSSPGCYIKEETNLWEKLASGSPLNDCIQQIKKEQAGDISKSQDGTGCRVKVEKDLENNTIREHGELTARKEERAIWPETDMENCEEAAQSSRQQEGNESKRSDIVAKKRKVIPANRDSSKKQ